MASSLARALIVGLAGRDWKVGEEVVKLDDGYTFECRASFGGSVHRLTQLAVGADALTVPALPLCYHVVEIRERDWKALAPSIFRRLCNYISFARTC